ncbi:hypothetical protein SSCG_03788 [Streptomyces clavuligerus]|nr:hypothetical protein SSCG_03788 [Streptomyces clavuligerus]
MLMIPGLDVPRTEQLVPQARVVGPDGEVFLLFPADSPAVRAATHAQDDELPAVLEITDVAPVSDPQRILRRDWWLTCCPVLFFFFFFPGSSQLRILPVEPCNKIHHGK